jgi:hypothetical protein
MVTGEEGAEGTPDGRAGRFAPDDEVDEEAIAGDRILLAQFVCRQACAADGDAPQLVRVVFGARWRRRWKRG